MSLETALMGLFLDPDKEQAYRTLLAEIGLPSNEPLTEKAKAFISRPDLRQPKNWRPLDYIQAAARRSLSSNGDYTFNKIPLSTKRMFQAIGVERIKDARIVDLGCGVFDPLLQSIYLYCNGARSVLAVDTEPCHDEAKAGYLTADMLADFVTGPNRWNLGAVSGDTFVERALAFDLDAFRKGDLSNGLAGAPITYRIGYLQDECKEAASQDLVTSFSVLEHVMDLADLLRHIRMILAPGGCIVSQIDFSDHRQYGPGFHFWSFMTGAANPGINGVRASGLKAMLAEAGFSMRSFSPLVVPIPDEVRRDLNEPYASLSDDDLSTVSAYFAAETSP